MSKTYELTAKANPAEFKEGGHRHTILTVLKKAGKALTRAVLAEKIDAVLNGTSVQTGTKILTIETPKLAELGLIKVREVADAPPAPAKKAAKTAK